MLPNLESFLSLKVREVATLPLEDRARFFLQLLAMHNARALSDPDLSHINKLSWRVALALGFNLTLDYTAADGQGSQSNVGRNGIYGTEVFDRTDVFTGTPQTSSWSYCNYMSESNWVVHAVHAGICENVIVIVQHQIQKQDLDDLQSGRELSRPFRDRYFIRSSVMLF